MNATHGLMTSMKAAPGWAMAALMRGVSCFLSPLKLRKLHADYDPSDKINAQAMISSAAHKGEVLTGLLFLSPDAEDLHAHLNTFEAPFNKLGEKDLCPGAGMLEKINAGLR